MECFAEAGVVENKINLLRTKYVSSEFCATHVCRLVSVSSYGAPKASLSSFSFAWTSRQL
eukprot:5184522-Pleurochrysis_carterae.AAC.1